MNFISHVTFACNILVSMKQNVVWNVAKITFMADISLITAEGKSRNYRNEDPNLNRKEDINC